MENSFTNVYISNSLKFNVDRNLQIYKGTTDQLVVKANNSDGSLLFASGTGGIQLDATMGASTTGTSNGSITLISQNSSSWGVTSANLTLSTINSGNLNLISAGDIIESSRNNITKISGSSMTLDAANSILIGSSTATSVNIGRPGQNVIINGNLSVSGSTTSNNPSALLVLNSSSGGVPINSGNDSGILLDRSINNIITDKPFISGLITTGSITGLASSTKINLANSTNYVNDYIEITSGPMIGQTRLITGMSDSIAKVSAWTPILLTGTNFNVTDTTLTGTNSTFTSQLSIGANINIGTFNFVVTSVIDDSNAVVESLSNVTSTTAFLISPGSGITYSIFNQTFVGLIWQESTKQFIFASTNSNPGNGTVNVENYMNLKLNNLNSHNIFVSNKMPASWDGNSFSGSIVTQGGISVEENILVRCDGANVGNFAANLFQTNSSGGKSVLGLNQADVNQSIIDITASSNDLTSLSSTLINTNNGNNSNISASLQGFVKVNITDVGTTNKMTNGSYYIPLYHF